MLKVKQIKNWLAHVNVNANNRKENCVDAKEEESMNEDGLDIGFEAAEFYVALVAGKLDKKARREENKQQHSKYNGCPIHHFAEKLCLWVLYSTMAKATLQNIILY